MLFVYQSYVLVCHQYVILMSLACACILSVRTRMSPVCHSHVLVCNGMSLEYTRMLSACHSHVLVCNGMSLVCTCMSSVCHSYVLVCHQYVTRMCSYVSRMPLVCGFTMNPSLIKIFESVAHVLRLSFPTYFNLRNVLSLIIIYVVVRQYKLK